MSLKIGIVGLPNVGKSTIFNALTKTKSAQAANYPFCTIDPNVGIVQVPDHRLDELAKVSNSSKIIPAVIEFVDIAGLVKGASEGEGLGNKFLAHIRECSAIAHVIRAFDDSNVIHVHGNIDPKFDKEIIESELILADIQTVENRLAKGEKDAKSGDRDKKSYVELLKKILDGLKQEKIANEMDLSEEEKKMIRDLHLLTMKPHLYILNVHEKDIATIDKQSYAEALGVKNIDKIIPISAAVEEELGGFTEDEAKEYLEELGIQETGLNSLIKVAYKTLGLITYFTSGPMETRAWTIHDGDLAPQAAGVIHTDFEKGFIKAEVFNWEDFVNAGGESKAKERGMMRLEGKEYTVKDGDVMHFKFSP
ncbi:MAG: redox-regulated ATPase YchF [Candidatus Gracilibacteria bacterium]|nr:redox-regulated ATPase YchF [Candidatus Gracilibacteria bacterium]